MKCDICGSGRVFIHIQQVADNMETDLHICAKCAKEKGLGINSKNLPFSFQNLIKNFEEIKKVIEEKDNKKICKNCNKTLDDIKKTGEAGCAECYKTFNKHIAAFLKKYTDFSEYRGKFPSKINMMNQRTKKKSVLQKQLDAAVKEEKYEEAACLRDKILFIEKQIEKHGKQQV